MCHWCDPEAAMPAYASKAEHDMWLYPHGRYGYTPEERIAESRAACPWCRDDPFSGLLSSLGLGENDDTRGSSEGSGG